MKCFVPTELNDGAYFCFLPILYAYGICNKPVILLKSRSDKILVVKQKIKRIHKSRRDELKEIKSL